MFRVADCLKSTHVIPNIFPNDPLQIIPVHSWRLRICPEPAGIRCTPTARARAISQLLPQLRILLLKFLYLSLVKRSQILFSIPCPVDSLSPSQQASSDWEQRSENTHIAFRRAACIRPTALHASKGLRLTCTWSHILIAPVHCPLA
jgi:hypothetical protein